MSDLDFTETAVITAAVLAGSAALYHFTRPSPPTFSYSLAKQSRILDGPERIRVSTLLAENESPLSSADGATTLYEGFEVGCKISGDNNCVGYRKDATSKYTWLSYNEVRQRAHLIGSGLMNLGIKPKDPIGIYSQNRVEWTLVEHGANAFSLVTVPLYDTLGPDVVQFISEQTKFSTVVCEDSKVKVVLNTAKIVKTIKIIVKFGEVTPEEKELATIADVQVLSLAELEELGAKSPKSVHPPKPSDWATICYTSGTTGMPKGAILCHQNLIAGAAACCRIIDHSTTVDRTDVHISYLPLAHVFERAVQAFLFVRGAQIAYFRGNTLELVSDIQEARPTFFPSVPRLLNRIHDKIVGGVHAAGGIKKKLFDYAFASKKAEVERGIVRNNSIWDKIVFSKVQATLGGRVRLVITGAAPISKDVLTFLRVVLGCHVLEGYGQTESAAASSITLPGDTIPGSVGPPTPANWVKLDSVPEMGYLREDDKGEICFKGPNVFLGYLNNEEKTKEALDPEGWLHSGDIGMWLPNGTLKIIDRKKNIFKLAQGEYIAPEKIENIYQLHPAVTQNFVYGDSLESATVGVVFSEKATLESWAVGHGLTEPFEHLIKSDSVKTLLLKEITALGASKGLKGFEQVKALHIHHEIMTVENGLLTPTFKAKRTDVEKLFKAHIRSLYADLAKTAPKA